MITEQFTANIDYDSKRMDKTKSEIIDLLSNNKFTISESEAIFKQVMYELVYKMSIDKNNLKQ